MKVKKAIKAIAALGAGISMVGATLMGAMAADLSNYPSPFVKNGTFDGLIVVGDDAAAQDVVGAIDVGASLQYAMRQEAQMGTGLPAVTISEGKKIEKTGNNLNYGDSFYDIIEVLDDEDLPVILADEQYQDSEGETTNKEDYKQTLRFYDNTGTLVFEADDDGDEVADNYLFFDDGVDAYNYSLEFDSSVEYTTTSSDTPAEDLEDTVLTIQGNEYTITDIKYDTTTYAIEKITLLAGETIIWLQQGKTLTRSIGGAEHEVEVTDVNDNENMCGVSVDGDVVWIDVGQTQTINGVTIGVTDAVAVHAQLQDVDICKINVGATELVLEDGKDVEMNGDDIEDSNVEFFGNLTGGELDGISIQWQPEDDEYIADGSSLQDPVFGNFEFKFAGVSKNTEEMSLTTSSDDAEFKFVNNDGKEVEIPYFYYEDDDQIHLGTDDIEDGTCEGMLLLEGENCDLGAGYDQDDIEGVMFLLITSGEEAHVMEVSKIDEGDSEVDLKDLTYSKTYDGNDYTNGSASDISLGSLGTIQLTIDTTDGQFTANDVDLGVGHAETKYGAKLYFNSTGGNSTIGTNSSNTQIVTIEEEGDDDNEMNWSLTLRYDSGTDDQLEIKAPVITDVNAAGNHYTNEGVSASDSDDDNKYYVTEWGTLALYDSDNDDDLTIWYPDEQAYGNAFVAPVGAQISGSSGEVSTVTLNPINVGAAKLASEVSGQETSQNLIAVGGPCINEAAAVVMGLEYPACGADSTIPENKAIVKLYENDGNVAMVIAGWEAQDTRLATTVVADYTEYADKLTGSEVVVEGTSVSDITVSAPSE